MSSPSTTRGPDPSIPSKEALAKSYFGHTVIAALMESYDCTHIVGDDLPKTLGEHCDLYKYYFMDFGASDLSILIPYLAQTDAGDRAPRQASRWRVDSDAWGHVSVYAQGVGTREIYDILKGNGVGAMDVAILLDRSPFNDVMPTSPTHLFGRSRLVLVARYDDDWDAILLAQRIETGGRSRP